MQKFMDDNAKEAKEIRKKINNTADRAWNNYIYNNSPRGKCESRCNTEYKKNTDLWKSCMDICKDKRSDILE